MPWLENLQAESREDLLTRSQRSIGLPELLHALEQRADSGPGKRECADPVLYRSAPACETALTETEEIVRLLEAGDPLPATPTDEIAPLIKTATTGGLVRPEDLVKVTDLIECAASMKEYFSSRPELTGSRMAEWANRLSGLPSISSLLKRSIDRDGTVLDTAGHELRSLRKRQRTLNERIHRRLSELISRHQEDVLQDTFYTERGQRYVLPVRSAARQKVSGIVHGSSGSGQTVFVEPTELIESNNELKLIDSEIETEIKRILTDLASRVAAASDEILENQDVLTHIDVVRARARLALELDATRPIINRQGKVKLINARHPLLVLRGHRTVPNDIFMDNDRQILVISGPNTGGKSAALTMLGLIAFTVRAGMFVPADADSEMAVFNEVFAVMGDEQDLAQDLSSFSAHILDIIGIIESAGAGSLVLLDELMSSTDPVEGGALAAYVLRELRDAGSRAAVTTHLPALKSFAHQEPGFTNAGFAFDPHTLAPTYRLVMDTPGQSLGIDIARRLGLSDRLIEGAKSEMDETSLRMESLVAELSEKIKQIETEREETEAARREARRLSEEHRSCLDKAREHEREMRKRVRSEAAAVVRRTEDELERILAEAKKQGTRESVHQGREKVRELSGRLADEYGEQGSMPDWTRLKKGDKVLVMPLSVEAELMETPGSGIKPDDSLQVRMGKLKVQVEANKVREMPAPDRQQPVLQKPARKQQKKKPERPPEPDHDGPRSNTPQTSKNTLDLRGMRYQEAEVRVEGFLDKACRERLPNVFIIHGHGTGALKKMVRETLSLSPYVSDFRPGEKGEGGDGVTMAELKDLSYSRR